MNQKGFIPIILVVIGAVALASATFGVVKYQDEIAATVSQIFAGFKVKITGIGSTGETPQLSDESEGQGEMIEEVELVEEPIVEEPVLGPAEVLESVRPPEPEEAVEEEVIEEEVAEEEIIEEEVIEEEIAEEEVIEPEPEPEELQQPRRPYGGYVMTGTPNPSPEFEQPFITSHINNQIATSSADFDLETEGIQINLSGTAEANSIIIIEQNPVYQASVSEEGIWSQVVNLTEGENNFKIKAKDGAGNESENTILTLYLDTESPTTTIRIDYDPENSPYDFTVNWSSSESDCTFDVEYLGGDGDWDLEKTSSTSKHFEASEDGTYEFRARATDSVGNEEEWLAEREIEIEYDDGYEDGYDDGEDIGKEIGYTAGYWDGYWDGYAGEQGEDDEGSYEDGYHDGYAEGRDKGLDDGYEFGEEVGEEVEYRASYRNGYEVGWDVGYDEGYYSDDGYAEGRAEGYDEGEDNKDEVVGYEFGEEVGEEVGYWDGYLEGFWAGYEE